MVCVKSVEVFSLMSPIGEMYLKVCPQGLHCLSQCDYISDENFEPQKSQEVALIGKEAADKSVQKHVKNCINWLKIYFNDAESVKKLPMPDICVASDSGPFQERVWIALAKNVGPGDTVSYGGLAKMVNSPGASQAVGNAMATNPIQIIVPCHRVIRSDGSMGFYSRGKKNTVKIWLLEHEGLKVAANKKVMAQDSK